MKELMRLITHVSCFVIVALFFALLLSRVRTFDAAIGVFLPGSVELPGAVAMITGGALVALCAAIFIVVGEGTPSPVDPTKRLVAVGPYKYVRNPIYIGQVTFFAGLGLYLRSVAILLFSMAWFFFCYLYVVLIEERGLKKRFAGSMRSIGKLSPDGYRASISSPDPPKHRSAGQTGHLQSSSFLVGRSWGGDATR